jgi:hypothetical protein
VLKIQGKRSGLGIRYPHGHFAFHEEPATKDQNYRSLVTALGSPVETSLIPVQIKIVRVEQPLPPCLSVFGSVDIHNLRLLESDDQRKGALEVVTVEQDETGKVVRKSANRIYLDLTPEQYATYLKSGFTFHQFMQPPGRRRHPAYGGCGSRHGRSRQPDHPVVPAEVAKPEWSSATMPGRLSFVSVLLL